MRILRCPSKEQMAFEAALAGADRIRQALYEHGQAAIVLASGLSQVELLEHLAQENLDWSRVTVFHLGEYVGIRPNHPASLRQFLKDRFVDKVGPAAFHGVAGERNPISECRRLGKLLADLTIQVAFVDIGEDGQVGLNAPPADLETESPYVLVKLDRSHRRRQVKEGWFGTVDQVPTKAISMSMSQILAADTVICTVSGARKAKAVQAALEGEVTRFMPASTLQKHPRALIYLDPDSAVALGPRRDPQIIEIDTLEERQFLIGPSKHFHLLVAADFTKIPESAQREFARRALDSGAVTVTVWGKAAGALELAFDQEMTQRELRGWTSGSLEMALPTTSFKPDEVDKALHYFLDSSVPAPQYLETCTSWMAVLVGKIPYRSHLLECLGEPGAFLSEYVDRANDTRPPD